MKIAYEKYAEKELEVAKEAIDSLDEITWTEEEERKLRNKIDRLVMPLLMFAFFSLQLDRGMLRYAMPDSTLPSKRFSAESALMKLALGISATTLC